MKLLQDQPKLLETRQNPFDHIPKFFLSVTVFVTSDENHFASAVRFEISIPRLLCQTLKWKSFESFISRSFFQDLILIFEGV
jgi:hypothetical protein